MINNVTDGKRKPPKRVDAARFFCNDNEDITMIEHYFEMPYWVIDILPYQVPNNSRGQYFEIEKYYLKKTQKDLLCRKFTNILLKLNCYYDINISTSADDWTRNPNPIKVSELIAKCMQDKQPLFILLDEADALITLNSDDTYMTIYNPNNELLELAKSLAMSEGLFIWKPTEIQKS